MSNYLTVKISGFDTLESKLLELSKLSPEDLRPALEEAGQIVAAQMAANAPEDTGLLKSNFNVKISIKEDSGKAFVGPGYPEEYPTKREK